MITITDAAIDQAKEIEMEMEDGTKISLKGHELRHFMTLCQMQELTSKMISDHLGGILLRAKKK